MDFDSYDRIFRTRLLEGARFEGEYGFPAIERTDSVPQSLVSFGESVSSRKFDSFVHFFQNDNVFMRVWNNPFRYLPILAKYRGVLAPDFSIMWNYPLFVQVESIGRSRMIGSWLQRGGCDVIPTARWGVEETYDFAFEGISPGGTVAVGTLGCTKNREAREVFTKGLRELLRRVSPSHLLVYGPLNKGMFGSVFESNIPITHFESQTTLAKRGDR